MIRLRNIVRVTVTPNELGAVPLSLCCLKGRAKWIPASSILSLTADVIDHGEGSDKFVAFLSSEQRSFFLDIDCQIGAALEDVLVSRFRCQQETFEIRSGTVRPAGPSSMRYYLKAKAEPDGAANGSQPIRSETNRTSSATGSRR